MELSTLDIILIALLIIIIPVGIWNQRRMNKKKLEQELYGDIEDKNPNLVQNENNHNSESQISNNIENPQILEQAKNYINTYKSQYPKESIEQGLVQLGISNEEAKKLIEQYW